MSRGRFNIRMRTDLQTAADRRSRALRHGLAADVARMREDAGLTQSAVARLAGVHPSVVSRLEDQSLLPTLETYVRICAALGADFAARAYPNTGPAIHDRHQVRLAELLLTTLHPRWSTIPEVAVRRPARGWIDMVLHDPRARTLVGGELESGLRRVEQIIRWSAEKVQSLPSADRWGSWTVDGPPMVSQVLIVRWTRANREVVAAARRQVREAYPADSRDALDALTGTARWPGSALVWARIDGGRSQLVEG
jgi:transcriptional regulator with XRE-family HTH domain